MRKTTAAAVAAALGLAGVLSAPASYADDSAQPGPAQVVEPPQPAEALITARRVMSGQAEEIDPSATVALRDLWLARDTLTGSARRSAEAMLARPSDGIDDPHGFGYEDPSLVTKTCNSRLCINYVPTGPDAPPNLGWVDHTMAVMDSVWTAQVDQMGFRRPLKDRKRGGSNHFDVYLKDLGGEMYGYCAAERRHRARTASGFCVLDNSFSTTKFPTGDPDGNLRVTAAHEFFHAVQYAYDYAEDPWMLESTATWIEERLSNDVNDNRQYLPFSQLYAPHRPLDMFAQGQGYQYGNWIFWEYLSTRFGDGIVKRAWRQAGSLRKDGGKYSFTALRKILRKKGGFARIYGDFAASNLVPRAVYPEGGAYTRPRVRKTRTLTRRKRTQTYRTRVHHTASSAFRFKPGKGIGGRRWQLKVKVVGPGRRTSPEARVVIGLRNGKVRTQRIKLGRGGRGTIRVRFGRKKVRWVSVVAANASTRMRCDKDTAFACAGTPRDDNQRFVIKVKAEKR